MPVIQVHDKQHALKPGQTRVGAGPGVDVSVSDDASLGVQAVLELASNNQVVIRRARDGAMVKVNGVALGVEPTPLIHGDKVDVSGTEVLFSEDKKVGATQFVSAGDVAAIAAKRSGPARATATTGGRLVSLVDGKEYQIPKDGVTFGREAGSDVVVAQPEVSRKHASIAPGESGYVITDHSTNGIWVNGNRVQGSQVLARADVVRVGSEEFRFYADVAPAKPTPVAAPAQAATPAPRNPSSPPTPSASPPASNPASASAKPAASAAPTPHGDVLPVTVPTGSPMSPISSHPGAASAAASGSPTAPRAAQRQEPMTGPATARPVSRPRPTMADKEEKKSGGISPIVWIVIIIFVAVAAYFLGQGRG